MDRSRTIAALFPLLIGYWFGPREPGWPDVRDFVDAEWDQQERHLVTEWLRTGDETAEQAMGVSTCRFCGGWNGSLEFSDATYIWAEGLVHYLEDHEAYPIVKHALCCMALRKNVALRVAAVDAVEEASDSITSYDSDWWRSQRPDWR